MNGVIPDASQPWVTVEIHGLTYRYTMTKDPQSGATVFVRNKDVIDGGYVFEESDDWSQKPGGNIQKFFRFPYSNSVRWGDGSIDVEGEGVVSDTIVTYNYRLTIDDDMMKCAATPLADPSCPGFEQALKEFLESMEKPDVNDPFYDEWVQANLSMNDEAEEKDEEEVEEPEEKESNFEKEMGGENTIDILSNNQAEILSQLANNPKIDPYYIVQIPGGVYEDKLTLDGGNITDNRRALRNLASDANHKKMVRSQYD